MYENFGKCECGEDIYPIPEARGNGGVHQCLRCYKFPAIDLDEKIILVRDLLDIKKYGERIHEWLPIDNDLRMINVETPFEEKIVHAIASNREAGTGFGGFCRPAKAVLLANENEFVGCIVWSKESLARLTWIFIRKEYRRRGYGIKFVKAWVEQIADKINEKYKVDSPNKASASLLFKLGHLKMEGEDIVEVKCFIIESLGWSPDMMFEDDF